MGSVDQRENTKIVGEIALYPHFSPENYIISKGQNPYFQMGFEILPSQNSQMK